MLNHSYIFTLFAHAVNLYCLPNIFQLEIESFEVHFFFCFFFFFFVGQGSIYTCHRTLCAVRVVPKCSGTRGSSRTRRMSSQGLLLRRGGIELGSEGRIGTGSVRMAGKSISDRGNSNRKV